MNIQNLIALSMVKGVGPAFIKKSIPQLYAQDDIHFIVRTKSPEEEFNIGRYLQDAEDIINECEKNKINIISILSDDYPCLLREITDPPCVLYSLGNLNLINNSLAIIGTRHSTTLGDKIAERLGGFFSSKYSICNGLVEGIDEKAITPNGNYINNAVGIISGGLNYSDTCTQLHAKIIDRVLDAGGLILSEYAPNQKEDRYSGSKASRIQAGLSKGAILVQSSIIGGSKYTVSAFAKLNRTLGVISYEASDEYKTDDAFGANRLISEKGIQGVANFIGIKNCSLVKLKELVILRTSKDYTSFEATLD